MISAPRFNETDAKAEIWFVLLLCGEKYPIISNLEYQGLITAFSNLPELEIIAKIKDILQHDPYFFKYVLKIVPVQFVCETNLDLIAKIIKQNYATYIDDHESFRITLKRRKNKLIERDVLINSVADLLENPVDLEQPDMIIRIELLGNFCGISFLESEDIVRPENRYSQEREEIR